MFENLKGGAGILTFDENLRGGKPFLILLFMTKEYYTHLTKLTNEVFNVDETVTEGLKFGWASKN